MRPALANALALLQRIGAKLLRGGATLGWAMVAVGTALFAVGVSLEHLILDAWPMWLQWTLFLLPLGALAMVPFGFVLAIGAGGPRRRGRRAARRVGAQAEQARQWVAEGRLERGELAVLRDHAARLADGQGEGQSLWAVGSVLAGWSLLVAPPAWVAVALIPAAAEVEPDAAPWLAACGPVALFASAALAGALILRSRGKRLAGALALRLEEEHDERAARAGAAAREAQPTSSRTPAGARDGAPRRAARTASAR